MNTVTISAHFENRVWQDGEAEKVARLKRYWAAQRNRLSKAIEKKERETK